MRRPSDLPDEATGDLRRMHSAAVRGVQLVNAMQAKVDERARGVQEVIDRYERAKEHFVQKQLPLDLDILMAAEQRRGEHPDLP